MSRRTRRTRRARPVPAIPAAMPILFAVALVFAACAQPVDGRPGVVPGASATPDQAVAAASPVPTFGPAAVGTPRATPTSAPTVAPTDAPTDAPPPPTAEPAATSAKLERHAFNLFETGDYVRQYTFEWCVGASLQMMLNLTDEDESRSRARQKKLWELAREHSFSPFGGANPRGWTAALNELGIGPYQLVSLPTYREALRTAAKALRETKRPVGLVMWRGRHAWVMSGFTSVGDPRKDKAFRVTGIRVLDPLYPHGSSVWGASPRPNRLLTPKKLAQQFVARDESRVNLGVPPGYLLVLPVL